MKGISIIICCFNSEKLLPETIRHIAKQNVDNTTKWELIIVNNNSSDKTKELVSKEWNLYEHKENCSFKVIDESNPGLIYARKRGLEESQYDYLIYCDDDNWLSENYLKVAFSEMENNDNVAVIGGLGKPIFENNYKPEWFDKYSSSYALGEQDPKTNFYVFGAGMVIRKAALLELYSKGFQSLLIGRRGNILSAGEDSELCFALILLGYTVTYNPKLEFKHFLTTHRLNEEYLLRMYIGFAQCNLVLKIYRDIIRKKRVYLYIHPLRLLIGALRDRINLMNNKDEIYRIYDKEVLSYRLKNLFKINKYIRSIRNIKK